MINVTYLFFHSDHPLHLVGQNSGAENATLNLAKALVKQGNRVIVAAYLVDSRECIKDGVEFWDFGKDYDILSIFNRAEKLEDYILLSACRGFPIFLSLDKKQCLKRFLICHDPSGSAFGVKSSIISRLVDGIICVSNAQRTLLLDNGADPDKVTVIYNGVDLEKFKLGDISKRDFKRIVFVGALVTHKGIDILLAAIARLIAKYPDLKLDVYGSASLWGEEEFLDQKSIMKLLPSVKFHGAVSQDEISKAFQTAGVCVIPSRTFDSFPLTAVEAQVCGCPVVCFNVGGLKECIEDGKSGVVINTVSIENLVINLDMLLSNVNCLEKFSKYAGENFRKKYDWNKTASNVSCYCTKGLETSDNLANVKIGFLTSWNQPCGIAKYAKFLLEEFKDLDVTILAEDADDADIMNDEKNVVRCWNRSSQDFSNLASVIKNQEIDVLYIYFHPSIFNNSNFESYISELKKCGLKIVLHLHCAIAEEFYKNPLFKMIDKFIVHSKENMLQTMLYDIDSSNISVVPLGLKEIEKISNERKREIRKQLGVHDDEKLILTFGFIQPHKGLDGVIEAVRYCRGNGVKVKGAIIGSIRSDDEHGEEYLIQLKNLIKCLKMEDYFIINNDFVSDDSLNEYIQCADLILLNYRSQYYENSGVVNLALSNGAVVATSTAPMFSKYDDCVWHYTFDFPIGVSCKMLLENQGIREFLQNNAKKFIKSNSFKVASNKIRSVLKQFDFKNAKNFSLANKENNLYHKEKPMSSLINSKPIKILFVNRDNAFTQRGGDTVVMERLQEFLVKKGLIVDICEDRRTANFKEYDLVHIFNFAVVNVARDAGLKAYHEGVPFVVTTLFEDAEKFYNQSIAVAKFFILYQNSGQNPDFFRNARAYTNLIPHSDPYNVSWLCENAKALLTSGVSESNSLRRIFNPKARIFETHFGLNTTVPGDAQRFYEKYHIKDFIFCVGRFETRKNQLMLLKALEDVDLPLVFASGGFTYQPEYADTVKNFKRKGETIILDKLSLQDLADAYAACKVHALASFYELPGLVSLEAAYYGANVVVTDEGSIRDYLKDYAFYCDPYSIDSIKNAVIAAYYTPVKKELKELVDQYSWERCADETINAYYQVLGITASASNSTKMSSEKISHNELHKDKEDVLNQKDVDYSSIKSDNVLNNDLNASICSNCNDAILTIEQESMLNDAQELANKYEFKKSLDILYSLESQVGSSQKLFKHIGAIELAQNNYDVAKKYFEKSLTIDNNDVKAICGLGICMMRQGNYNDAIEIFVKALRQDPYQSVTILQLIECAYVTNKFDEIKEALEKYLNKFPDNVDMLFAYCGICYKINDLVKAQECLDALKNLMPLYNGIDEMQQKIDDAKNINMKNNQSYSYQTEIIENNESEILNSHSGNFNKVDLVDEKLAKLEEAKKKRNYDEFEQGVDELMQNSSLNQEHREYVNILKAESLMLKSDNNSALEILEQVIAKNPASYKAISDVGILMATCNKWEDAKSKFQLALSINKHYDVALAGMGLCCVQENDLDKAYEYYMDSLEVNPENVRALLGVIDLSYKLSRLDDLEKVLKNYLELHSADLNFLYSLAACYYGKGEYEKSLDTLSKIFLFDKDFKMALELQNLINEKLQNKSGIQI